MRANWQALHAKLMRTLDTLNARREFGAAQRAQPALRRFQDLTSVLDFLHGKDGDLDAKDQLLAVLVDEAQAGGHTTELATTLLWLGLWPGLDALYRRLWRHFWDAPEDLVSEIAGEFTIVVHRADTARIKRVAATLIRNVERNIRCRLQRLWENQARRIDLLEDEVLQGGDLTPGQSALGLPHGIDAGDAALAIHKFLADLIGSDADLVVAVVIQGEGQREVADRLGIGYDAARKRFQRSLTRLRRGLEG